MTYVHEDEVMRQWRESIGIPIYERWDLERGTAVMAGDPAVGVRGGLRMVMHVGIGLRRGVPHRCTVVGLERGYLVGPSAALVQMADTATGRLVTVPADLCEEVPW